MAKSKRRSNRLKAKPSCSRCEGRRPNCNETLPLCQSCQRGGRETGSLRTTTFTEAQNVAPIETATAADTSSTTPNSGPLREASTENIEQIGVLTEPNLSSAMNGTNKMSSESRNSAVRDRHHSNHSRKRDASTVALSESGDFDNAKRARQSRDASEVRDRIIMSPQCIEDEVLVAPRDKHMNLALATASSEHILEADTVALETTDQIPRTDGVVLSAQRALEVIDAMSVAARRERAKSSNVSESKMESKHQALSPPQRTQITIQSMCTDQPPSPVPEVPKLFKVPSRDEWSSFRLKQLPDSQLVLSVTGPPKAHEITNTRNTQRELGSLSLFSYPHSSPQSQAQDAQKSDDSEHSIIRTDRDLQSPEIQTLRPSPSPSPFGAKKQPASIVRSNDTPSNPAMDAKSSAHGVDLMKPAPRQPRSDPKHHNRGENLTPPRALLQAHITPKAHIVPLPTDEQIDHSLRPQELQRSEFFARHGRIVLLSDAPPGEQTIQKAYALDKLMWQSVSQFFDWYMQAANAANISELRFELYVKFMLMEVFIVSANDSHRFRSMKQSLWNSFWTTSISDDRTLPFSVAIGSHPCSSIESVPSSTMGCGENAASNMTSLRQAANFQSLIDIIPQLKDGPSFQHTDAPNHRIPGAAPIQPANSAIVTQMLPVRSTRYPENNRRLLPRPNQVSTNVSTSVPYEHQSRDALQRSSCQRTSSLVSPTKVIVRLQRDASGKLSDPYPISVLLSKITAADFFGWFALSSTGRHPIFPPSLCFTFKDAMPAPVSRIIASNNEDHFNLVRRDIQTQLEKAKQYTPKLREFAVLVSDPAWVATSDDKEEWQYL